MAKSSHQIWIHILYNMQVFDLHQVYKVKLCWICIHFIDLSMLMPKHYLTCSSMSVAVTCRLAENCIKYKMRGFIVWYLCVTYSSNYTLFCSIHSFIHSLNSMPYITHSSYNYYQPELIWTMANLSLIKIIYWQVPILLLDVL